METSDKNELLSREQFWIDTLDVCNKAIGYNLAPTAGNTLGFHHSGETKSKLAEMKIGTKMSSIAKQRMRDSQLGRTHPQVVKDKIGLSRKGDRHPLARLTWDEVREIRKKVPEGFTQEEMASLYGVKREAIGKIVRNERWKE